MTGPLKAFPTEASSLPSILDYQKHCQNFLEGRGAKPIDLAKALVANRTAGDGTFQILYNDGKDGLYCSANVNWRNRSIQVKGGLRGQAGKHGSTEVINETQAIPDACALTRQLVGEEELKGEYCADGQTDPRLTQAHLFSSAQFFLSRCSELQESNSILTTPETVDFSRVRLVDEVRGDGQYSLLYENPEENFFCEGFVDSTQHLMLLRHGHTSELVSKEPEEGLEMKDACSMTTGLLGKDELVGECIDKTEKERDLETYLTYGFYGTMGLVAYWGMYKIAKRLLLARVGIGGAPVWRHLAGAYLAASLFDAVAGIFLPKDNAFRKYGALGAGAAGLVAPNAMMRGMAAMVPQTVRTAVATRLAATAGRSFWGGLAKGGLKGLAGGLLLFGANWAWRKWITGSDYQSYINKRVADEVYDEEVYDLDGWDLLVLPLLVKGVRAGSRALAPDMMNSAITWDNDGLEDKYRKEDRQTSEELEKFISEVLPPLLSYEGKDPQTTIALLRDAPIKLTKAEAEASELLFKDGPEAVEEKFELNAEKIEELSYLALLKKVQDAASYLVFVDQDRNDWAREVFNRDGTLKAQYEDPAKRDAGEQPYQALQQRFPYTPPAEPENYWVNLRTGDKIPAAFPICR